MSATLNAPTAAVLGEALVDIIESGADARVVAGGSPMNVAVGLARLGIPTQLAAQLGADDFGDTVREHLQRAGVIERIETVPATSSARARIQPDGSARYDFDVHWTLAMPQLDVADLVHVGSIGSWMQPGSEAVYSFVRSRPVGVVASFDPNLRPALAGDRDLTVSLVERLAGEVDIVKLSDEDAEWLYPGESVGALAQRFFDRGVYLFALTRGSAGSHVRTPELAISFPAAQVGLVDTVGAGDAFMSGMLFAIASRGLIDRVVERALTLEDVCAIGVTATASAAVAVSRRGAEPPTVDELASQLLDPSMGAATCN